MLTLQVRYNDGYVAWLNGVQVAAANAPLESLDWNSSAGFEAPGSTFATVNVGNPGAVSRAGTNVLAFQVLNVRSNDSSLLLVPELFATTLPIEGTNSFYFRTATPGYVNSAGTQMLGPGIFDVAHDPQVPMDGDPNTVRAMLVPTFDAVGSVTLRYRVMYQGEVSVAMHDDGAHGDGAPGDNVFGAVIPATASVPGQMVRYVVQAEDIGGRTSRWPLFNNPVETPEYLGTVVQSNVVSKLPVFQLFISPSNLSAAESQAGTRASFFHDGEFYDNIHIEVRGNTTATWNKKSHRLEFNREHPLRHPGPGQGIRRTSLLAEFGDPSYLRHHLSFWMQEQAGVPSPFCYPVHVRLNGAFWQLAYHNDVLGEEQMERLGYDPEGALYKAAGSIQTSHYSLGNFQKLLPKTNGLVYPSSADFDAFATAISESRSLGVRKTNLFDVLNVPEVINYLAVARICHEGDDVWANMSVYRDTHGSQEWSIIPFDMNASWGQLFYSDNPLQYRRINATDDFYKSHPLYGGSQIREANGANGRPYNRIYDVIISVPETRQMLLRRMRTVMDTWFQPPGTPLAQDLLLQHIHTMTNLIWEEARLDRTRWLWPPNTLMYGFGPNIWLTNGVKALIEEYIEPRRQHLFYTHSVLNTALPVGLEYYLNAGIPTAQPHAFVGITGFDYNPASGNQDQEFVRMSNTNAFAVDISGWKLKGGIEFTFKPGTVLASNSLLYVSPNVRAFRSRTTSPRGGQGLFVQGNYSGRLNAWGESLQLFDASGTLISSNGYPGNPSLPQRYLRVTELMYNPSPAPESPADAQDFEFIELKNISTNVILNLNGIRFSNGIDFDFSGGAVATLGPQQRVLVVRNATAFATRHGAGHVIAGEFTGGFDNDSEPIRLEDAAGEKILEFDYEDDWNPITDGHGFSLVIVNELAHWSAWDDKANWKASGGLYGSPGVDDPPAPVLTPVLVNEVLTHTDSPQLDLVELFNPSTNAASVGGWFLTDNFNMPRKFRIPTGTVIPAGGYLVFTEHHFGVGPTSFRFNELGESVFLFSADANTNLTGYVHGYEFGEAPRAVSFGRYLNSQTNVHFTLQSVATSGTNNAYPRVGPVVISELMYHPPDSPGVSNLFLEFIELHNITQINVALYDPSSPTNTWRLRNAIDYDFPTGHTLAAGERLIVVGFDPADTTATTAFRVRYGISNHISIFGPWSGSLANSGETLELKQPEEPSDTDDGIVVPYIMIDKVAFEDSSPWPAGADGVGNSLQRVSVTGFGNDPTNWFAAGISAGRASVLNSAPSVALVSPAHDSEFEYGAAVPIVVSAFDSDGTISRVVLLEGGAMLHEWTQGPFSWTWNLPPPGRHDLLAIAYDNVGGVARSVPIQFRTADPPVLSLLNQIVPVPEGDSAFLTVPMGVSLSRAVSVPVTVRFATSNLTAIAGVDYVATNGVLTFQPGERYATITVSILGDTAPELDEYFLLNLSAPSNCALGLALSGVVVENDDASDIDYFTEAFTVSTNDLAFRSFTFTPDGSSDFYSVCQEPAASFPAPTGGSPVVLGDDAFQAIVLPSNETVAIYQRRTNVLYIGSNGYITMDSGDGSFSPSFDTHFDRPRVSGLFDDLNPTLGGFIYWRRLTNRVAVTYENIREYGAPNRMNSFQIELFFDGRIRITYLRLSSVDGLAGLSGGLGLPPGMLPSDLSAYGGCPPPDTDGDGLPDFWETSNGTNPGVNDAAVDLDGDGLTNLQEFWAGTHPNNATSSLRLQGSIASGGSLILSFDALSNRSYSIQQRVGLTPSTWQPWQNFTSSPADRVLKATNSSLTNSGWYRLVTPMQ